MAKMDNGQITSQVKMNIFLDLQNSVSNCEIKVIKLIAFQSNKLRKSKYCQSFARMNKF